jgi:NAD(P)-dependent dehydrogenase (short-subunit alcohol dehydrogenase family)
VNYTNALVTGGGRNLGQAIALRLAHDGFDVAILSPDKEELDRTAAEIRDSGRRTCAVVADLRDEAQVSAAVRQVRDVLGPIGVLVNNSGVAGPTCKLSDTSLEDWNECLAVNLTGAFLCAKAVVSEMAQRKVGKIINISSIAGRIGYPLRSPYAASKWGMVGLTLTWAKELGAHNIQVNAVCPGPVDGPRMDAVIRSRAEQTGESEDHVRSTYYLAESALGRMVSEDDVAAIVAYLASPLGDNITGQAIEVAAGFAL